MLSLSQNVDSLVSVAASLIVSSVASLLPVLGELCDGSGDVPHDELAPPYCETDEDEPGESEDTDVLLNWKIRDCPAPLLIEPTSLVPFIIGGEAVVFGRKAL
jgi:hypothetical protein